MLKNKQRLLSVAILAAVPFTVQANITVDGELNDWLKAPTASSGSSSDWDKFNTTNGSFSSNVSRTIEDQDNNDFLYPGSGGQQFDAEAMYLKFDNAEYTAGVLTGGTLNLAIVTGLNPVGSGGYEPGDIAFDLDGDAFSFDSGGNIVFGDYNTDGYEYGMIVTSRSVALDGKSENATSGSLVKAKDESSKDDEIGSESGWYYSGDEGLNHSYSLEDDSEFLHPTQIRRGDGSTARTGNSDNFAYEKLEDDFANIGGLGGDHYLIETSISFSDSTGYGSEFLAAIAANTLNVHWNPTCDNDNIMASLHYNAPGVPSPGSVPEPGSLALVALGLIGFGVKKRRS